MSKKAEARAQKKFQKEADRLEKSARQFAHVSDEKVVRQGANPGSIFAMKMVWTANGADRDGVWSWGVDRDWSATDWEETIRPALVAMSQNTWAEIEAFTHGKKSKRHRSHHSMDTDVLCKEARERLAELEREEDSMFRFRLGNMPRLWGFRVVNEFRIFWFDPTHEIYPTEAK